MTKTGAALLALASGLVVSNAWWAHRLMDAGMSLSHAQAAEETQSELLGQAMALLPVVAQEGVTRREIVAAAQAGPQIPAPFVAVVPFEQGGYVWVGELGLQFNAEGQLVKAVAGLQGLAP